MAQAKVLADREIKKVLLYIAARSHATRNRCMFLLTHGSGMRVGEGHSGGREAVHVRSDRLLVTECANPIVQIVERDHDDVRALG